VGLVVSFFPELSISFGELGAYHRASTTTTHDLSFFDGLPPPLLLLLLIASCLQLSRFPPFPPPANWGLMISYPWCRSAFPRGRFARPFVLPLCIFRDIFFSHPPSFSSFTFFVRCNPSSDNSPSFLYAMILLSYGRVFSSGLLALLC